MRFPVNDRLLLQSSESAAPVGQYRIRDLLLVTLILGVLLGLGRAFGGGVGIGEVLLMAVGMISITVAAVFLRRRWVWGICLAASFPLTAAIVPANLAVRFALGAVMAAHFLFAAMPILAVDPQSRRWPWVAAAAGCQLAAALFTPPDTPSMAMAAIMLSWGLSLIALVCRYQRLRRIAANAPFTPEHNA